MVCIPLYIKSSGIFLPSFFLDFCTNTFTDGVMDARVNFTYLCLIPKCKNTTTLKNYRPIGLCTTQYKIITKFIANRIKPFLQSLIGDTQASFLSKRRASDNATIVQEYIDHFRRMKGKNPNMILKINLEKTFDRLE